MDASKDSLAVKQLNSLEGTLRHDRLHKRQGMSSEIFSLKSPEMRNSRNLVQLEGTVLPKTGWPMAWPTVPTAKRELQTPYVSPDLKEAEEVNCIWANTAMPICLLYCQGLLFAAGVLFNS